MNNQCNSIFPSCKCNYGGSTPKFDSQNNVRPNLGSIELDYNVEMPTNFIRGLNGKSAYEYAVKGGYKCSERQFYKDLAGVGGIEPPELRLLSEYIKIGEDITVFTGSDDVTIGGYRNGDVIPANATLLDVLKGIFKKVVEYIYTEPVIEFNLITVDSAFSNVVTPIIGEPIYLSLTVNYTRGDAGYINSVNLSKDSSIVFKEDNSANLRELNRVGQSSEEIVDKVKGTQSFRINTGLSYSGSGTYITSVNYNEGAVHYNSIGVESPGNIHAGTFNKEFVINAIYPILYRCSDSEFSTDNLINNLANRNVYGRLAPDDTEDHKCEFSVPINTRSISIAIPGFIDSLNTIQCVLRDVIFDKLSANMDTLSSFNSMNSISGIPIEFMGMNYVIYYINLDLPISVIDTCRIILTYRNQ